MAGVPHEALGGQAPMTVWRERVSGALNGNAVDMTLRWDDAAASTTHAHRDNNSNRPLAQRDQGGRAGSVFNRERPSSGPADGVHFSNQRQGLEHRSRITPSQICSMGVT